MTPAITIIIASRNRAPMLEGVLHTLANQQHAPAWEVIVVDNGSADETPQLLARMATHLPIVPLCEPRAGKSRALNRALEVAEAVTGELVLFTDDDVRPSPRWLAALYAASRAYPQAHVFCGPIVPEFPVDTPAWLRTNRFAAPAFADFRPNLPEGLLPAPLVPFGPNFAVRRDALAGRRFRLDLGPSDRGSFMCEDTDFLEGFRHRGEEFVFVPSAFVRHQIRADLTRVPQLLERAFNLGRSEIIRGKPPGMAGPDPLPAAQMLDGSFELGCVLSFVCGQMYQLHAQEEDDRRQPLIDWIRASSWSGDPGSIAGSAEEWLRSIPEALPPGAFSSPGLRPAT
jgi:glycosyltransferase involved in cell wall biosynthesis